MKKMLFLVFLVFSFIPFSVNAEEIQEVTYDYTDFDLSNNYDTDFQVAEEIVQYYNEKNEKFLLVHYGYVIYAYFFDTDTNISIESLSRKNYRSGLMLKTDKDYKFCTFGIVNFSDSDFQNCDSNSSNDSSSISLLTGLADNNNDFTPFTSQLPYYSSFNILDLSVNETYPLNIKIKSSLGTFNIINKGSKYIFYRNYQDSTIEDDLFPEVTFEIISKHTDTLTNTITSVVLQSKISKIDKDYSYYYSTDDGKIFTPYENDSKTYDYTFNDNGHMIWKIISNKNPSSFKTYTFSVDGIGKKSSYYESVLDDKYSDILEEEDEDGNSLASSVADVLDGYFNLWSENFPILSQIGEILSIFTFQVHYSYAVCPIENESGDIEFTQVSSMGNTDVDGSHYARNYCVPDVRIDFSKVVPGLDSNLVAIDFSSFNKYRDVLFTLIKIVVGVFTFFKVFRILGVTFKR